VFGLADHGGRLYYAASEGPQIWSVGLGSDGAFEDDPRLEFDVPLDFANGEITDITFTADRKIVLAQRGRRSSREDGLRFHSEAMLPSLPSCLSRRMTRTRRAAGSKSRKIVSIGYFEPYSKARAGFHRPRLHSERWCAPMAQPARPRSGSPVIAWAMPARKPSRWKACRASPCPSCAVMQACPSRSRPSASMQRPMGFGASGFLGDVEIYTKCDGQLVAELDPYEPPVCSSRRHG
jgi:hypothetical protein